MALDPTIALQAQAPSFDTALKPLSSLLGIQGAMLNLKRAQDTYDADVAQRQAESQNAQVQARIAQATEKPMIEQQEAATAHAKTQAAAAQFKLTGDQLEKASQIGAGMIPDPDINSGDPTKIIPKILDAKQRMIEAGIPAQTAEVQAAHLITVATQHPEDVPQILRNSILQSMAPVQQAQAIKPDIIQTDNGQQIISTNYNPLAAGGVGSQPIGPIQKQLPPTTPTYDNKTGQMGYLGSMDNPAEAGFDPSKLSPAQKAAMIRDDPVAYANGLESFYKRQSAGAASGRVASGPPIGAAAGIEGSQGTINDQWKALNEQAGRAGTDVSLLQNIKQFAHNAAIGQLSDKESFINGLAARLGMSSADLKKTDTDLLAKNSAMLALTGGNTDAARALAEAANPNTKMNEAAIRHAADQIISQKQMAVAQQQYLLPYKRLADQGHPEAYQAAKAQFDAAADPRIFQYPNMSQDEKFKMKNSMSPAEQEAFREKVAKLKALGVIQ
jgi:hypothetical protein